MFVGACVCHLCVVGLGVPSEQICVGERGTGCSEVISARRAGNDCATTGVWPFASAQLNGSRGGNLLTRVVLVGLARQAWRVYRMGNRSTTRLTGLEPLMVAFAHPSSVGMSSLRQTAG